MDTLLDCKDYDRVNVVDGKYVVHSMCDSASDCDSLGMMYKVNGCAVMGTSDFELHMGGIAYPA